MLEAKPRAVVGGENDEGVFGDLFFAQSGDEAADLGIDVLDDIDVGIFGILVLNFIRDVEGDVGHGVWKIEEEWFFFGGAVCDELDGFVGIAAGDGALVNGDFDDLFILYERGIPFGESAFRIVPEGVHALVTTLGSALIVGVVHVVGVGNAVILIEAIGGGEDFGEMAKMPLADAGGGVTVGGEVVGEGVFIGV